MDIVLLLSKKETERKLRKAVWAGAAICVAWALGFGAAFTTGQTALSAAHASFQAKQTAFETQRISYRAMQRVVERIPATQQATVSLGTSDMAYRLSNMAQDCGARMTTIQFADPTVSAASGVGPTNSSSAVQCTFSGTFDSLLSFIDGLSDSSFNLQLTSIDIDRKTVTAQTGLALVDMRLSGNVSQ